MKSALSFTLVASIVMASLPVGAQEVTPVSLDTLDKIVPAVPSSLAQATVRSATPVISPHAESRFPDARLVSRHAGGQVDEVTGVLVSDPEGREIRFETGDRAVFAIPYDRITAMQYEEAKYPPRFLDRPSHYLTVHYSDSADQDQFESVRLLSERNGPSVLTTLETDTGLKIDRSVSMLPGLPMYVTAPTAAQTAASSFADLQGRLKPDQTVYVQTAEAAGGYGPRIRAKVLELSGSTLRLLVDGQRREFAEGDVLVVSEHHTSKGKGALIGLAVGVGLGLGNLAYWCQPRWGSDSCGNAGGILWLAPGFFALTGAMLGGQIEHERVLFVAPDLRQQPGTLTMTPFVGSSRKGLAATFRF